MKRLNRHVASCALGALATVFAGVAPAAQEKASPMPAPEIQAHKRGASSLSGKVVETMNSGGYTYVCIEMKGQKTWVAVPEITVALGQKISFLPGQEMTNFSSKSLGRTFDSIIFSPGPAEADLPSGHRAVTGQAPGSKAVASPADLSAKVEKAAGPNAYTVGEIYKKRKTLNNKACVVKGKVVKVSAGIMGKNWIHVQDGTGDPKKNTHNLVVTSDDLPSVGDVVTMKGVIMKDKDFGGGYKYTVIMEKASMQR